MKKAFRMIALILSIAVAILSGCGLRFSNDDKNINIAVIIKKIDADFWKVVRMGTEAAQKEFNVNVSYKGPTDENDIEGQIDMVEAAISAKADAIVLAASDYVRLVPVAEKAMAQGIPVIIIDSAIKSDKMLSFIGTDNVEAGQKLGETLVEKVGSKCNVVVMSFVKGAASNDEREQGFMKAVAENPGINVLSTVYCNSIEDTAEKLTGELVKKYPDLDAIVALNAYGAVGTARAINNLGLTGKIKIIGFDCGPEEISFLEKDVIQALVVQNPFSMGYQGIKYALDAINGKDIPKRVDTRSTVIDKNNMYLPENQKLLFPFTD